MIVVVAALAEELAPLARRLAAPRRLAAARTMDAVEGRLAGATLRLIATGAGGVRARAGLRRALAGDAAGCERLILLGVAGGLDPRLATAEVVRVGRVVSLRADAAAGGAPAEHRVAGDASGVALTVDRIVADAAEKQALWQSLGRPGAAVVDMESFHWIATLAELPTAPPHIVLRAVSDTAAVSLPSFLPLCVGPGGEISRVRVAARTLTRPRSLGALMRLRRDVRAAAERLADAVEEVL